MKLPFNKNKAVTMMEILIATFVLAVAFIPIIGVMGTGISATKKDEVILKAVQLGNSTMNTVMQLPFNDLVENRGEGGVGVGSWTFGGDPGSFEYATGSVVLSLGEVTGPPGIGSYSVTLQVRDREVAFNLWLHDPNARAAAEDNPALWGWVSATQPMSGARRGLFHEYLLSVSWVNGGQERVYRLVSYKANLD